ncbi:MAG: adenylate/guanylate cyclase domain-containing protein [Acidobacteria bacterium]|nr:adenylate/guanylate cyclase domain-containing protein [Acidobacteriota bacterium]
MAQPSGTEREQRQAQTILFTDIVGSSQYFAERGDTAGLKMLARHNQLLFPIVTAAGGRVVKTIGDSIFATFGNPGQAVRAAWAMQRKLEEANQAAGEGEAIRIRIGVHYGLVTVQKGDVFGDAVNMAERVKSKAGGGQITLSRVVRDLLRADPRIGVRSLGMVELKGSPEPVELFELQAAPGVEAEKATRRKLFAMAAAVLVLLAGAGAALMWRSQQPERETAQNRAVPAAQVEETKALAEVSLRHMPSLGETKDVAPEGATFASKDRFQIVYRPREPHYLYAAIYDVNARQFLLVFPQAETIQPLQTGETFLLPSETRQITLDEQPKQETILLIVARHRVEALEQTVHSSNGSSEKLLEALQRAKEEAAAQGRWSAGRGAAMNLEARLGERPAWIELKIQHR